MLCLSFSSRQIQPATLTLTLILLLPQLVLLGHAKDSARRSSPDSDATEAAIALRGGVVESVHDSTDLLVRRANPFRRVTSHGSSLGRISSHGSLASIPEDEELLQDEYDEFGDLISTVHEDDEEAGSIGSNEEPPVWDFEENDQGVVSGDLTADLEALSLNAESVGGVSGAPSNSMPTSPFGRPEWEYQDPNPFADYEAGGDPDPPNAKALGFGAVTCANILPWWPDALPAPFDAVNYYSSLLELCAAEEFGGKHDANLGGVCDPADSPPSFALIKELANPALSMRTALRVHCAVRCRCLGKNRRKNRGKRISLGPKVLIETAGGGYVAILGDPKNRESLQTLTIVAPSERGLQTIGDGSGRRRGSCRNLGVDGSCKLRPEPVARAQYIEALPTPTPGHRLPTPAQLDLGGERCAGSCSSFSKDCRGDGFTKGCGCYMDLSKGEDHFNAVASCWVKPSDIRKSIFGPRGMKRAAPEWACPCNSSYVSEACCLSDLGIVWEPKEMQLGMLKAL
ncbi:MAG: hypothetical protein M1824_006587 [Vezdaea acicularis]|nr:MAG: hypothetical protein M1824_006587 [Vezdaea acicularis]